MARRAAKALGDIRALEEEDERMNPIHGGGATPSMGLSQFRGGYGMDECDDRGEIGGGRRLYHPTHAHKMGHHLSSHLHRIHGAGWWDDFKSGFNSVVAPVAGVAKKLLPMAGPYGTAASGILESLGYGRHHGEGMSGAYEGKGSEDQDMRSLLGRPSADGGPRHGVRRLPDKARPPLHLHAVEGGRRHRKPAGPNDGRRKRAEIVKKVMAQHGLSMIAASKYVKEHGLY
jgi:hypothetical protein